MGTIRILLSGITGRTGQAIMQQLPKVPGMEVTVGLSHQNMREIRNVASEKFKGVKWYQYFWLSETQVKKPSYKDFDIIVDCSHSDRFEQILDFAAATGKPLVSITSGLSDLQMEMLQDATGIIPIFRDGNCRFKVKIFIDEVVKLARRHQYNGGFDLYENFYHGKKLPSETSKVLQRKLLNVTGRTVKVHSSDTFC